MGGKLKNRCLSCGYDVTAKRSKCPNCSRSNPTHSLIDLTIGALVAVFICVALGIYFSLFFFLLAALFCVIYILTYFDVKKSKKHPMIITVSEENNTPSIINNKIDNNPNIDCISDFKNSLAIVWANGDYDIEFSYESRDGERSRRKITLEEISVTTNFTPYIVGFCHLRHEQRCFKMERILSKVKYDSRYYELYEFLETVLHLEHSLVIKLEDAIHG